MRTDASTPDQPSPGHPFDDQWSYVRETVNMLFLAICQIEATMRDSNTSVETLTQSFTNLAEHTRDIGSRAANLQADATQLSTFQDDIQSTTREIQQNINASIQAFQFYDRVCQRLDHVSRSLENVTELLDSGERIGSLKEWRSIQERIKSSYTMEAERIMFEFIMRGGGVKEALEVYRHHFDSDKRSPDQDQDEIELF